MATDIDSLQIQINAQATKANDAIDRLVDKLDRLTTSLSKVDGSKLIGLSNGVQRLGTAMQSVNSKNINAVSRLSENITKLSTVNISGLQKVAASLPDIASEFNKIDTVSVDSQKFAELANGISKLGNKSATNAVTNIPKLATVVKGLMTTLSRSPQVSQNVIQMTNALANLSAQGSKVGTASNSIVSGLNKTSVAANKSKKSFKGLASTIGKLYAGYFWVYRAINGLKNSIIGTSDYLESFNYFEVALNKVGKDWSHQYEQYGYASAEAYADSFKTRLTENLNGLSGLQLKVGSDGMGILTDSGLKNLGLNIEEITQNASQLASVTNSIGQTGEVSLAAASAFTKLGADMSSLFNIDYSATMKNLQSGLIGQSRALYKYGIDITNATLETYAYSAGVDKAVSEMTQGEKMQLRMLAILDQSKVAWGDLANTINSPSNMMRQFTNNVKEAGMVLGQLFIPLLQKVMPVINGVTIALKRMLVSFASVLGIELDLSSFGQSSSDITEDMDGLSDSLDGVAESAENAKKGVRGFDELNVVSSGSDSKSGSSGDGSTIDLTDKILQATEGYESAWNAAFAKMENTAIGFADKIEKALEPVKKIFRDFVIGDFFQAGQDVSNLVVGINNFFASAIDNVDWEGIGNKIGEFFAGINWLDVFRSVGNLMWQGLKAAFELAVGVFDSAPLETALISLATLPKLLKTITSIKFVKELKKLAKAIRLVASGLAGNKVSTKLLITQYPKLGKAVDVARKAFANFQFGVDNGNIFTGLNEGISTIRNNLTGLQKGAITAIAGFAEFRIVKTSFEDIVRGSENVVASIAKIGGAVGVAAAAMYTALGPAGLAIAGITGVVGAISGINEAFDSIRAEEIGQSIKNAMTNPGGTSINEIAEKFSNAMQNIGDSFSTVSEKSNELANADSNIRNTWLEIEKIEKSMEAGVTSVEAGKIKLAKLFGELAKTASDKFGALETTLLTAFGENGVLNDVFERLGISTENTTSTIIQLNDKVEQRIEELTKLLAETDPSNPNYAIYREELASLTAQTDELADVINDYQFALSQIDYSNLYDEKGNLDAGALEKLMGEISTATVNAQENVTNAVSAINTTLNEELNEALKIGDTASAAEIQEKLNALPDALKLLNNDIALKAVEITDTIQNDFISKTSQIIDDKVSEWNEKSAVEKWWNGVFGAGSEGEYVKEAVDQQQKNIDELSEAIEKSLKGLKIDGVAWSSEAAEEIYGALFDSQYIHSEIGIGHYKYTLNHDYKEIIKGATEGISELAAERGKDAVDGYSKGIFQNQDTATKTTKTFVEKVMEMIAKTQKSNSPSKVTQNLGKDAVDGYILGFSDNQKKATIAIKNFADNCLKELTKIKESFGAIGEDSIKKLYNGLSRNTYNSKNQLANLVETLNNELSKMKSSFEQIGIDSMNGLYNGLSSVENILYKKAQKIADNVSKTMKIALDIHSPSKVMAELGRYTIEGFKTGMEKLYKPTLESLKEFSYNVEVAPVSSLTSMYESYQPAYASSYTPSYSYLNAGNQKSNEETNALLRELLVELRKGQTIELDGGVIAGRTRKIANDYARVQGKPYFEY